MTAQPEAAQTEDAQKTVWLDLDMDSLEDITLPLTKALAIAHLTRLACNQPDAEPGAIVDALQTVEEHLRQLLGEFRPLRWVLTGEVPQ
jgi:hypothetical protein